MKYKLNHYTYIEQDVQDNLFYIILVDERNQWMHESQAYDSFEEALEDYKSNH